MSAKGLFLSLAALIVGIRALLRCYPAFGGIPSKKDGETYHRRNPHFDKKQFQYPNKWIINSGLKDVRVSAKQTVPKSVLPVWQPDFRNTGGLRITWIGHSSVLLQNDGINVLIDPIFSERCFPLQWIGPRRFSHPSVQPQDLPDIHILLLTHDHHDHLDPQTIRALDSKVQHYVVSLGLEKHLLRWGIDPKKIHRMAWWEKITLNDLEIICAPTRHFSGRRFIDQNRTQWCSFVLRLGGKQVFVSGDGGFGGHFAEIRKRCGNMDFALMECGQYNRRWHFGHLYPEESVKAAEILGVKCAMPVHWGAFVLSDHAWDDSPERFVRAAENCGIQVVTPHLCETISANILEKHQVRWWQEHK